MRDLLSYPHLSLHRSNFSRRQLLRYLGYSAGAAAGLSALPSLSLAQTGELVTLNMWASGTMTIDDYWGLLEEDEAIRINFSDNGNDPGPVIARMVFGNANDLYDVGGLQGGAERELAMQNAIMPWDMSKIPNWEHVWSWAKEIPYIRHEGEQYGVPTVINADSMIYLPDRVGMVDTYASVFDPALKGKTAMEDAWINSVIFTAIYLKENNIVPIGNPGNLTEDELGAVMEFLIKHKRDGQFRTFWNGWEQGVQLIASEEVWVMTGWEPIVYAARERGINAEYAVPKEGYEGWSNDLLLHRGSVERGNDEAAHRLANWELGGYYGCVLGKLRGYMVPTDLNVEVARANPDQFDPEFHENLAEHVKAKFFSMKGAVHWQNVRPDNFQLYEEWWQRLRNV
jgi:putative spermidine/putrescine transport system substrate-binding protein